MAKKAKRESKPKVSGQKKVEAFAPYAAPQSTATTSFTNDQDHNEMLLFGDDHYDALAPGLISSSVSEFLMGCDSQRRRAMAMTASTSTSFQTTARSSLLVTISYC